MRFHREWPIAQVWSKGRDVAETVKAENLAAARIVPVIRRDMPGTVLDLVFRAENRTVCVPLIYVDQLALAVKLRDTLIWPEAIAKIVKDSNLAAIERAVYPWVEFALVAEGATREKYHVFGDANCAELYQNARTAKLFGAGSFDETIEQLAIAHYAARFALNANVAVAEKYLTAGALLLPSASSMVFPGLDAATRELAEKWYGFAFPDTPPEPQSVVFALGGEVRELIQASDTMRVMDGSPIAGGTLVPYIAPVALDDLVRFGEGSPAADAICIAAKERPVDRNMPAAYEAVGGSHGQILILVRRDIREIPGADLDEAEALARCLRAEGFSAVIQSEFHPETSGMVGLLHVVGLGDPELVEEALETAKQRGVPVVITPLFEDAAQLARWGTRSARSILATLDEELDIDRALARLAAHQVEIDGATAVMRLDDGLDSLRREILRRADVVTVQSTAERELVQRFSGRRRRTLEVPTLVSTVAQDAPVAHLVPDMPFVLVHGAANGPQNLGLVIRAIRELEMPAVMIAPPVDRRMMRMLQALANTGCSILPSATPGECEAIYERAAVYVDAAWQGDGIYRIMQAAACGAELAVSQTRCLPEAMEELVSRVDPASIRSIQEGISSAWQRAVQKKHGTRRLAEYVSHPEQALRAYVQAYAQAGEYLGQAVSPT